MDRQSPQSRFIELELLTLAVTGAFGRASTYADDASKLARQRVRATLCQQLEMLAMRYEKGVNEAQHLHHIEQLVADVIQTHAGALKGVRLRIGPPQEALNLYLEYLWCLGKIPGPPHCPVDSIVLQAAGATGVAWTQMDLLGAYRHCIDEIRLKAGKQGVTRRKYETWSDARHGAIAS